MYYKKLDFDGWQDIYSELEPVYRSKIPVDAGTSADNSFTMFTVQELHNSPTLVKFVKNLGLYEYWKPGPIFTLGPHKAIPIHYDYNFDKDWHKDIIPDAETIEAYKKYEILSHRNCQRETILIPLHNCENSVNYFYELKDGKDTTLFQTHQKLFYHIAERSEVEETASFVLDAPTIFRVDKLHSAVNYSDQVRITLNIRFLPCAEFDQLKAGMV